jgi:2-amino-4-hydroxy-6-hydroxymethyldihydropteridine diphosphokinase
VGTAIYAIALGANRRGRCGGPEATIAAALARLDVVVASSIHATPPLGPSTRRFANAAALVRSDDEPHILLARLKAIERDLGRRAGLRWGARVIDLDIILWSGGRCRSRKLQVPHAAFRQRRFVLAPLAEIAGGWRDPVTGYTVRQLLARLDRRRPRF